MKQNTKLTLGNGRFSVDDFPVELKNHNGLVAMPAIIDFTIGEEIVLYWIDRTPFIKEVAAQKPLRLVCHDWTNETWPVTTITTQRKPLTPREIRLNLSPE